MDNSKEYLLSNEFGQTILNAGKRTQNWHSFMKRVCLVREIYEWILCEESIIIDLLSIIDFIEVINFSGDFLAQKITQCPKRWGLKSG